MRELVKSVMKAGWGLSLFGAQRAMEATSASGQQAATQETIGLMNGVAQSVEHSLSPQLSQLFQAGNEMQSRIVDMSFGMAGPAMDPSRWMSAGTGLMQQMSRIFGGLSAASEQGCNQKGWGEMPPVGS